MSHFHDTSHSRNINLQFGIAGLMSYFIGTAVYFALIATVNAWARAEATGGRMEAWLLIATPLMTWIVLEALYRKWRLRQAEIVHGVVPIAVVVFGAVALPFAVLAWCARWPEGAQMPDVLLGSLAVMAATCGWSSIVSFPAATLMLLVLVWPKRE
jgi:hypothetical protein